MPKTSTPHKTGTRSMAETFPGTTGAILVLMAARHMKFEVTMEEAIAITAAGAALSSYVLGWIRGRQ